MSETKRILNAVVIQADYFAKPDPDKEILSFLFSELERIPENSIVLLPEYTNACGLSGKDRILSAIKRTDKILASVSNTAKQKHSYLAVNALEYVNEKLQNHTILYSPAGERIFTYQKRYLPPLEKELGIQAASSDSPEQRVFSHDGIRFGFLTCYDIYFSQGIEQIAAGHPDVILFPTYQRGERSDIIRSQTKLLAFRCNSWVIRTSCSLGTPAYGSCSMIVAPDGQIKCDLSDSIGMASVRIDPEYKYYRSMGFGGGQIRNDEFISAGLDDI